MIRAGGCPRVPNPVEEMRGLVLVVVLPVAALAGLGASRFGRGRRPRLPPGQRGLLSVVPIVRVALIPDEQGHASAREGAKVFPAFPAQSSYRESAVCGAASARSQCPGYRVWSASMRDLSSRTFARAPQSW
jgi:hypothetical protein